MLADMYYMDTFTLQVDSRMGIESFCPKSWRIAFTVQLAVGQLKVILVTTFSVQSNIFVGAKVSVYIPLMYSEFEFSSFKTQSNDNLDCVLL